jgi:hypothetical protein
MQEKIYTDSEFFFMTTFLLLEPVVFQPRYSLLVVGSHQLVARCVPR